MEEFGSQNTSYDENSMRPAVELGLMVSSITSASNVTCCLVSLC